MFRSIYFLARTDIVYMLRQKETLLWTFVMPVVFMYFIGMVTGGLGGGMGGPSDNPVPLALVVEAKEGGFVLDELIKRLEENKFLVRRDVDAEILARYRRRLTIPASKSGHGSFTEAVLAGEETVLRFRRTGDSANRNLDRMRLNKAVYTVLADLVVNRVQGRPPNSEEFDKLRTMPRNIKLTVRPAGKRKEIPTGYDQTIPGVLVMFTMMILLTGGAVTLVTEREQGLLRRLASTPITRGQIVAGKWFGKLLLGLVQIGFALIVSVALFDIDWGPEKLMVGVVLLSWAAFNTSLAMFLANVARSEGQMSGIGVLGTLVLAALGGCWWPIEVTPDWMQSLARGLPTGWAMESMHLLVSFHEEGSAVVPHVLALLTGAVILGWLSQRTFRYQ